MIEITRAFLPPIEKFEAYLKGIWERGQLTNHGPLVNELEEKIRLFLGVKNFIFVSNGTLALQIAIKAVGLKDEVITTPFSYVATTSSLVWEGCKPIFGDIHPTKFTLDASKIEHLINEKTTGILATHVYGNPCEIDRLQALADKHNLKLIFDAAHAFGVKYQNHPVVNFGDISILSFHAIKTFHTIEGGGLVTNDDDLAFKIRYLRNFGHNGQEDFHGLGINAKPNEFQAAMGLCVLPYVEEIIRKRELLAHLYDNLLQGLPLQKQKKEERSSSFNHAYYPIVFSSENELLEVRERLRAEGIFPRRYFYPPLNLLPYITWTSEVPYAESISKRVMCLPLHPELKEEQVIRIAQLIRDILC
jgi:dTDP-4-amino-4,6-dideoxygalactose transaminase